MRPPLVPVNRGDRLPASYNQEERVLAGGTTHVQNNTVALGAHLCGPLDVAALETALNQLVARHEGLRLTFSVDELGGRMHVAPTQSIAFTLQDVELVAPSQRVDAALRHLANAAAEPFDLAAGPLIRATAVRLSDTDHMLAICIDHILVDARSCTIILGDLFKLYGYVAHGEEHGLEPLPVQFPDWTVWERRYLQGPTLQRLMRYWRDSLTGVDALPASGLSDPSIPARPPANVRPAVATAHVPIDGSGWERLCVFARSVGSSPFAVCSAMLKATVYLHRRLTQPEEVAADVTVFGAFANRSAKAVDDVVGYFATSAVLRTDVSGDPTLIEMARRETRMLFGALAHQALPHPVIAKELSPPLYGIRYRAGVEVPRYLNFDMPYPEAAPTYARDGLTMRVTKIPVVEVPRGGLRLIVHPTGDGLLVELRHRTDRFSATWVRRFLSTYGRLLDSWTAVPDARLSAVATSM